MAVPKGPPSHNWTCRSSSGVYILGLDSEDLNLHVFIWVWEQRQHHPERSSHYTCRLHTAMAVWWKLQKQNQLFWKHQADYFFPILFLDFQNFQWFIPFATYVLHIKTKERMTLPLVGSKTLLISFNKVRGWSQRSSKFKQLMTSYWNPVFCHSFIPSTLEKSKRYKNP